MEIVGWIGGLLFAFCGVPQAIKSYRTKHARDISWWFLWMWVGGEILTLVYVLDNNLFTGDWQLPLLTNYALNTIVVAFIMYIKWKNESGRVAESG